MKLDLQPDGTLRVLDLATEGAQTPHPPDFGPAPPLDLKPMGATEQRMLLEAGVMPLTDAKDPLTGKPLTFGERAGYAGFFSEQAKAGRSRRAARTWLDSLSPENKAKALSLDITGDPLKIIGKMQDEESFYNLPGAESVAGAIGQIMAETRETTLPTEIAVDPALNPGEWITGLTLGGAGEVFMLAKTGGFALRAMGTKALLKRANVIGGIEAFNTFPYALRRNMDIADAVIAAGAPRDEAERDAALATLLEAGSAYLVAGALYGTAEGIEFLVRNQTGSAGKLTATQREAVLMNLTLRMPRETEKIRALFASSPELEGFMGDALSDTGLLAGRAVIPFEKRMGASEPLRLAAALADVPESAVVGVNAKDKGGIDINAVSPEKRAELMDGIEFVREAGIGAQATRAMMEDSAAFSLARSAFRFWQKQNAKADPSVAAASQQETPPAPEVSEEAAAAAQVNKNADVEDIIAADKTPTQALAAAIRAYKKLKALKERAPWKVPDANLNDAAEEVRVAKKLKDEDDARKLRVKEDDARRKAEEKAATDADNALIQKVEDEAKAQRKAGRTMQSDITKGLKEAARTAAEGRRKLRQAEKAQEKIEGDLLKMRQEEVKTKADNTAKEADALENQPDFTDDTPDTAKREQLEQTITATRNRAGMANESDTEIALGALSDDLKKIRAAEKTAKAITDEEDVVNALAPILEILARRKKRLLEINGAADETDLNVGPPRDIFNRFAMQESAAEGLRDSAAGFGGKAQVARDEVKKRVRDFVRQFKADTEKIMSAARVIPTNRKAADALKPKEPPPKPKPPEEGGGLLTQESAEDAAKELAVVRRRIRFASEDADTEETGIFVAKFIKDRFGVVPSKTNEEDLGRFVAKALDEMEREKAQMSPSEWENMKREVAHRRRVEGGEATTQDAPRQPKEAKTRVQKQVQEPTLADQIDRLSPDDVETQEAEFQFRTEGTKRQKYTQWDNDLGKGVVVYLPKGKGAKYIVVDGHHRVGTAKRFHQRGDANVWLTSVRVLKEADGWTPYKARIYGALRNMSKPDNRPQAAWNAALIYREVRNNAEAADIFDFYQAKMDLIEQSKMGERIAELGDDAFKYAVASGQKGLLKDIHAAAVGDALPGAKYDETALGVLHDWTANPKTRPKTQDDALAEARMAYDYQVQTDDNQLRLFGGDALPELPRAEKTAVYRELKDRLRQAINDGTGLARKKKFAERSGGAAGRVEAEAKSVRKVAKQAENMLAVLNAKIALSGDISRTGWAIARDMRESGRDAPTQAEIDRLEAAVAQEIKDGGQTPPAADDIARAAVQNADLGKTSFGLPMNEFVFNPITATRKGAFFAVGDFPPQENVGAFAGRVLLFGNAARDAKGGEGQTIHAITFADDMRWISQKELLAMMNRYGFAKDITPADSKFPSELEAFYTEAKRGNFADDGFRNFDGARLDTGAALVWNAEKMRPVEIADTPQFIPDTWRRGGAEETTMTFAAELGRRLTKEQVEQISKKRRRFYVVISAQNGGRPDYTSTHILAGESEITDELLLRALIKNPDIKVDSLVNRFTPYQAEGGDGTVITGIYRDDGFYEMRGGQQVGEPLEKDIPPYKPISTKQTRETSADYRRQYDAEIQKAMEQDGRGRTFLIMIAENRLTDPMRMRGPGVIDAEFIQETAAAYQAVRRRRADLAGVADDFSSLNGRVRITDANGNESVIPDFEKAITRAASGSGWKEAEMLHPLYAEGTKWRWNRDDGLFEFKDGEWKRTGETDTARGVELYSQTAQTKYGVLMSDKYDVVPVAKPEWQDLQGGEFSVAKGTGLMIYKDGNRFRVRDADSSTHRYSSDITDKDYATPNEAKADVERIYPAVAQDLLRRRKFWEVDLKKALTACRRG